MSNLLQHLLNFDDPPAEPDDLPRVDGLIRLRPDTTLVELPPREGKGPYHVRFEPCPYLCLCLTATADHPGARWEHPKVVSRVCRILEFRRDLPNGGRHWTRKAGLDFSLIVPKAALALVAEPGYSYPKIQIGGERVTLNASGGGGGVAGSWTDYVGVNVHTLTNLAVRTLNAVADATLTVEEARETGLTLTTKPVRFYLVFGSTPQELTRKRLALPPPPPGRQPMWLGLSLEVVGRMLALGEAFSASLDGKKLAGPDCRVSVFFSGNDRTLAEDIGRHAPPQIQEHLLRQVEEMQRDPGAGANRAD